nr:hypothetical protein [Tanacetum cinerariifolium]GFB33857.1 hypothetical protein [Tanacetum cinerariifolium]
MYQSSKEVKYAYLKEIMVTRTDEKEYKFCEADFPNLNQNDITDMILLKIQNKVRNIKGPNKLEVIVRNNKLGYSNEGMERYYWTKDDEKKTTKFIEKIKKTLKE